MAHEKDVLFPCGDGWCVQTPAGLEGPLETQADASRYLALLNRVNAARTEVACTDSECFI